MTAAKSARDAAASNRRIKTMLARRKQARKEPPFEDSFAFEEAELSVRVGEPWGKVDEAVILKIDCNGEVSLDEEDIHLVISMLENAKADLRKRKGLAP